MRFLYRTYQLVVCFPILLLCTGITAILTIVGCTYGDAEWWGYWPACIWSRMMCRVPLLRVEIVGREKIDPDTSYVFVANHQGPYDIFLIYGYLGHRFRWLMKKSLAEIPVVGRACLKAGHILVDKSGPKAIGHTQQEAARALKEGASIVVFPEGSRTYSGHMAHFRRGPFVLGHEMKLPVVPLTIDGSFDVLPRQKGFNFVTHHTLRLVIHDPIPYNPDLESIMRESYEIIERDLPEKYRGFRENPD